MLPENPRQRSRRAPRLRVGIAIAALFSLLITLTMSVFVGNLPTHAQSPQPTGDPIFAALVEAGMIEPVNLTRTIDDVTVTLEWVYADVQTLAVHYTAEGLPPVPAAAATIITDSADNVMADDQIQPGYVPYTALAANDGTLFAQSSWQVSPKADAGGDLALEVEYSYYAQGLVPTADGQGHDVINDYFDATYGGDLPESVPLKLAITFFEVQGGDQSQWPSPYDSVGGIGPFEFNIDVPLFRAIYVTLDRAETVGDLTLALQGVDVTPVQTVVYLCFDLPDGGDWQPVTSVLITDENGDTAAGRPQSYGLTALPDPADSQRCTTQTFGAPFSRSARVVTVTVDALRTSIPETREYWEAVRDSLAQQDIVIELVMSDGRYYDMISYPDDMTDVELGETIRAVQESLLPTVDGPWVFEVGIP